MATIQEMTLKDLKRQVVIQRKSLPVGEHCPFERELLRREYEARLLNLKQAAAFFSISEEQLLAKLKCNTLPYMFVPGGVGFKFDVRQLAQFIPSASFKEALKRARGVKDA